MIDKHYFSHQSPTYGSPFRMMESFGIRFSAAGENIAYGQRTPQEVMNGWMNSTGHRSNILNPTYTKSASASQRPRTARIIGRRCSSNTHKLLTGIEDMYLPASLFAGKTDCP
jgi:uncharacterized protein YkwD